MTIYHRTDSTAYLTVKDSIEMWNRHFFNPLPYSTASIKDSQDVIYAFRPEKIK
jgi:hypothetical protein